MTPCYAGIVVSARSYVANRVTDKLTPITDRIFCCRSGSAADTQAIADYVRYAMDIYRYLSAQFLPYFLIRLAIKLLVLP